MDSNNQASTTRSTYYYRWGIPLRSRSRRRQPTIRLGGKKKQRRSRGGLFLVRLVRRIRRIRWLMKKIKEYYNSLIEAGGGSIQAFQQRLLLEASFGVPVMGLGLSFPTSTSYG